MPARRMRVDDIGFAVSLICREGWGHTRVDLLRLLSLSPSGSFVWETDGRPCGFVTSVRHRRTAMIGHVLVSSDSRGRQIGKSMMSALLSDIDSAGMESTMLYATTDGAKLYEQFGFVNSGHELVAVGVFVKDSERSQMEPACDMVQRDDIEALSSMDARTFGDDRSPLIARLHDEFPEHCFKLVRQGEIVGFAFGRRTPVGFDIGPWICMSGQRGDATALLDSVIHSFPGGGRTDISPFAANRHFARIVGRYHPYRKAERVHLMVRGEQRYTTQVDKVFGVAGFELG
ncbi:MAG: GNAT family N-acetyltransferase [Methanobacteriota archaeon]|nr:MAG: GNAT family N-acetyltransferase [Euryarchaeota archaeon]